MISLDPDLKPTRQAITDPDLSFQVILDPHPDSQKVLDPNESGSATLKGTV